MRPDPESNMSALAQASAIAFATAAIAFSCGGLGTTLDRTSGYDDYHEWRIGTYRGQFCWYHRTTTAGATPPGVEELVGPILPVYIDRGMESNRAAYHLVAVPTWPLFLVVAWPALIFCCRTWPARIRKEWENLRIWYGTTGTAKQRGFEPISLGPSKPRAVATTTNDPAIPPAPASRTPGQQGVITVITVITDDRRENQ